MVMYRSINIYWDLLRVVWLLEWDYFFPRDNKVIIVRWVMVLSCTHTQFNMGCFSVHFVTQEPSFLLYMSISWKGRFLCQSPQWTGYCYVCCWGSPGSSFFLLHVLLLLEILHVSGCQGGKLQHAVVQTPLFDHRDQKEVITQWHSVIS